MIGRQRIALVVIFAIGTGVLFGYYAIPRPLTLDLLSATGFTGNSHRTITGITGCYDIGI